MFSLESFMSCNICPKTFSSQDSLQLHIRRNHLGKKFCCYYCNHETKFKDCLARHIRSHHLHKDKSKSENVNCAKCPLCIFQCFSRQQMISHYATKHNVAIQEKTWEFGDWNKFMEWKESIEQEDVCQFTTYGGPKKRQSVCIRYYRCFRDGNFRKKGKGLRPMKIQGSVKINGVCPASIKAEEHNITGVVRVTYIYTHVGHEKELNRLTLSKHERAEIARKIAMGIPYKSILEGLHEHVTDCDIRRVHLTTRKDLWNIENSLCQELTGDRFDVAVKEEYKGYEYLSESKLKKKKMEIQNKVEEILEKVKCDEHFELFWNALLSIEESIQSESSLVAQELNSSYESDETVNSHKNLP